MRSLEDADPADDSWMGAIFKIGVAVCSCDPPHPDSSAIAALTIKA
jgi:hypothetical protein